MIRVLVIAPGKPCEVREIPNATEAFQAIVGGYFELFNPGHNDVAVYWNEDALPLKLPACRKVPPAWRFRRVFRDGLIRGTFFICALDHGGNCESLDQRLIDYFRAMFDAKGAQP